MSCFLISLSVRERTNEKERELARESVCVRGRSRGGMSVPWGRCVFSLLLYSCNTERGRKGRAQSAQSAGDRRNVPRKYEQEEVLSFSFVQTQCRARVVSIFVALSLSRDCERANG